MSHKIVGPEEKHSGRTLAAVIEAERDCAGRFFEITNGYSPRSNLVQLVAVGGVIQVIHVPTGNYFCARGSAANYLVVAELDAVTTFTRRAE